MENEDRTVRINGPLTKSAISMTGFQGPVTYNYPGSATVNVADSVRINKEILQRMRREYSMSLKKLPARINEELNREKLSPEKEGALEGSANDWQKGGGE